MGDSVQRFAKGIHLNLDAAKASLNASDNTSDAAKNIKDTTDKLNMERNALAAIARHLEERDHRSKWDWVTMGCAMLVAAGLAGAGAVYFTKQQLDTANFQDPIRLIQNDDDAYWCGRANGQNIQGASGTYFCAVPMGQFQETVEPAE